MKYLNPANWPEVVRIRLHRVIIQLILISLFIRIYGWLAFLFLLLIFISEFVGGWLEKFDAFLNPWYRKWLLKERTRELVADLTKEYRDKFHFESMSDEDFEDVLKKSLRYYGMIDDEDNDGLDDDDNDGLDDNCPCCKREYDEIDREHQICHFCGHENEIQ